MASQQSMTQTIIHAATKYAKAVILAIIKAETPSDNARPIQTVPRMGSPTLEQPTFNLKVP